MKKVGLVISVSGALLSSQIVFATNIKDEIPCPDVSVVRQIAQQLDTAQIDFNHPDKYMAFTQNAVLEASNKNWYVGTDSIPATNSSDALIKGQANVANAEKVTLDYAVEFGPFYICAYTAPIGVSSVKVMAPKNNTSTFLKKDFRRPFSK